MQIIALTRGKTATVDDADFHGLSLHRWHCTAHRGGGYAAARIGGKLFYMHAVILGTPKGMSTDHIDGNGLNNTRSNLRIVTVLQNSFNMVTKQSGTSSIYRGVCWQKRARKWQAQIKVDGRMKYLGLFVSENDAAAAYDAAGFERDPEHFTPNFPVSLLATAKANHG